MLHFLFLAHALVRTTLVEITPGATVEQPSSKCCGWQDPLEEGQQDPDAEQPALTFCLAKDDEQCTAGADGLQGSRTAGAVFEDSECAQYTASTGEEVTPCVDEDPGPDPEEEDIAAKDEEPDKPGYGSPCNTVDKKCSDGYVCSMYHAKKGGDGVCKYAALETCSTSWGFGSKCASSPYGVGHTLKCRHHDIIGSNRCCIPSQSKHWGEEDDNMRNHRPMTKVQYLQAHPGRTETADGIQIGYSTMHQPKPKLVGYTLVRNGRRGIGRRGMTKTGGHYTEPPLVTFLAPAGASEKSVRDLSCCSGWRIYGHDGVLGNSTKASGLWYCGYRK